MPDTKITALAAITTVDPAADVLPIVDVSDTSMAASGTTKKITSNQILGAGGTATLASATITGDLTVDTSTLKVDSTNNRVGIGTASPSYALSVNSGSSTTIGFFESTGSGAYLGLKNSGSIVYFGNDSTSGSFIVQTPASGFSTKLTLDNTGNLGLGVTPSASSVPTFQLPNGVTLSNAGTASSFAHNAVYNSGWKYVATGAATLYQKYAGAHTWYNAASGTAGNAITFTQAMTLDASGNLLVGTTSAGGNRLNVQTASGDCLMLVKSQAANTNLVIDYVSNYGNFTIRKNGAAVWDYGVISDSSATPAFKFQNASSVGVQLVSGATAWTTLSDETMKDIIEPISNAVAKVGSLRSVIGKFKTDQTSKRRSFLIAQDVQSVLPEAVDVVGENNELGLRYTEVIPLLVAAIKELTARVQTLETR